MNAQAHDIYARIATHAGRNAGPLTHHFSSGGKYVL